MIPRGFCVALVALAPCFAQQYTTDTVAGTGTAGFAGDNGPATRADLNEPGALALDPSGRLLIADTKNNRVRLIEPGGVIRTVAGNGDPGNSGDGGPATAAALDVTDIAVDSNGVLYIVGGGFLRAVNSEGVIWSIAGPAAGLTNPASIAAEQAGTVVVADGTRLLRIRIDGTVSEVSSAFPGPISDIAIRADGILIAAAGDRIYTVSADGSVTPLSAPGTADANTKIAVDVWGELYIAGEKLSSAGDEAFILGGIGASGMAVDRAGNVYYAEPMAHRIRVLRPPLPAAISPVSPGSRATEVWPRNVTLVWTPVRNAKTYEIFFGTNPDALERLPPTTEPALRIQTLKDRTTYYWRVGTRLRPLPPVVSPLFSFTTTTVTGQPPEQPRNPSPGLSTAGMPTSLVLRWSGSGTVQYDVYLSDNQYDLAHAGAGIDPRMPVAGLKPNTVYYWRVVASNEFGQTASPRWQFTTGSATGFPWLIDTVVGRPLPQAEGSVATEAPIRSPQSVASDGAGNLFFIEDSRRVMRIAASSGRLSTVFSDARGVLRGLAVDSQGNIYVGLPEYVMRITRTGQRSAFAGQPGGTDFRDIRGLALDRSGRLYIADTGNHQVRTITSGGQPRTVAGDGNCGDICSPQDLTVDSAGNVYVYSSGRILRIRPEGNVETVTSAPPVSGLAADSAGVLYFADAEKMMIRRVTATGEIENWAGEPDASGSAFGFFGDGLPAARAKFALPNGIAFNSAGEMLIADSYNNRIRKIDRNGFVSTIAGIDTAGEDRTFNRSASLYGPTDVAVAGGLVYIADSGNHRVRRLWPNSLIETVANGDMTQGGTVDTGADGSVVFTDDRFAWAYPNRTVAIQSLGGQPIDSRVRHVGGIARGPDGEIYVSDTDGHRILRVAPDGTATLVAGTGTAGFAGDGGPAYLAQVHTPGALSLSPDGLLYVAENGRVRVITSDGRIATLIHENANGLAHDWLGNLYLSTSRSIFMLTAAGQWTRIAGNESAPAGMNNGGLALATQLNDVRGIAVSASDEIYFADAGANVVRRLVRNIPRSLVITAGNNQTVPTGELPAITAVKVVGYTGQPVPGVPVQWVFTSTPTRSIINGLTGADGTAAIRPNLTDRKGTVTIQAISPGLDPVSFTITVP